jgi:MFS family permease
MGSINAVPSYTAYYDLPSEGNSSTGLVFAIFQIGQMVGAFFSWVADWHGRRWPIFVGCFGTCVGAIVTAVAPTIPAFIGGRFMLSFFSTIATVAAPIYLIEIAPPQYRGTVAGLYNTLYYLVSSQCGPGWRVLIKYSRDRLLPRQWSTAQNSAGASAATSYPGDFHCGYK